MTSDEGVAVGAGETMSASEKQRRLRSEDLFDGEREITIEHCNVDYRLRITGNGKLILTK